MTQITVNLKNECIKDMEIKPSTILKKDGDLFIVSLVTEEKLPRVDPIEQALFYDNIANRGSYRGSRNSIPKSKYALISLSNGLNYFKTTLNKVEFKKRVSDCNFKVVNHIEYTEL